MDPTNFFAFLRAVDRGQPPEAAAVDAVQGAAERLDGVAHAVHERLARGVRERAAEVDGMRVAMDLTGPVLERIRAAIASYESAKARCDELKAKIAECQKLKENAKAHELELMQQLIRIQKQYRGLPREYKHMDPGSMEKWYASVEQWSMTHKLGRPPTHIDDRLGR